MKKPKKIASGSRNVPLSNEAQLVHQAISGSAEAYARLYDAYVDDIYRFVYYRVGNEQTAEDLTAQVFMKAWDSLNRYQQRGAPFQAWLFQITRNLVIDYYRTRKETESLDVALSKPDPAVDVPLEVEQRLAGERVRRLLQNLTEDQQEVLTLKFINGLSTKEVARVMKKRQGAIRALQMRALQTLAGLVGEEDE